MVEWAEMKEPTASEIRLRTSRMEIASDLMSQCLETQARRVAKHYLSHILISQELLKAAEYMKQDPYSEVARVLTQRLLQEIKDNHAYDFGIELEWRKREW